ncbi:MAG: hypothetical protein ACE5JQ_11730 [Candidatus Methylomirabilales bacterium]
MKRFAALMLAMVLFAAPTLALAAWSGPTLDELFGKNFVENEQLGG